MVLTPVVVGDQVLVHGEAGDQVVVVVAGVETWQGLSLKG